MDETDTARPQIFTTVKEVRDWRLGCILANKKVGYVPTMGALHDGHISLINQSLAQNHTTIMTIFVNPSQFAPTEDLDLYPRTAEDDIALVSKCRGRFENINTKVDAIFFPRVEEVYPSGIPLDVKQQRGAFVSVLGLSEMLEGRTRPNFFRGVATVITKFFNVIQPTNAYFGEKDIQQTLVIKQMVKDLLFDVNIVVCKLYREESGLALSSRNKYLDADTKEVSCNIYKMLQEGKRLYESGVTDCATLLHKMHEVLQPFVDSGKMKIDYISINDKEDLSELQNVPQGGAIVSCAIYVKNSENDTVTRLIDNVVL